MLRVLVKELNAEELNLAYHAKGALLSTIDPHIMARGAGLED